ncbi:MAG: DEAD/DEAH box helicase [Alphaproteobacteria bacterium]
MTDFQNVRPALASALTKRGYTALTPVQDAVLANGLEDQDLLVSAQTGSGKTVAFGLALAPTLLGGAEEFGAYDPSETPLALAIAPTRELALQVKRELEWLYKETGAKLASCVGGMDMRDERRTLVRGAHIVVGTPGRLCDHIKRGSLDMSGLAAIVLDEADEMLKMGFREELDLILSAAPEERRTLMFSATVPKTIIGMTKKYQKNAVRINTAAEAKQHLDIEYRALTVAKADQENAIINVLRYYDAKNAIVFGDTRVAVNRMASRFNNRGFSAVILSGELSQKDRSHALQALRDGRAKVCIATDVAARGLDLPDLELVIHASIPKNREALLHRSGRTGRAGRKGVSALIVPHNGRRRTERLLRDANITAEWGAPPSAEDVLERDNDRLLEETVLAEPVTDSERIITEQLLEAYSPEHIAAAYVRQYRASRSAPEELTGVPAYDPSDDRPRRERPQRSARNDFEHGIWFSLNLGRKQKAEPRWILPMLCKSGDLKKGEIGAIKISETRTFVEVAPEGLTRFIQAIGPDGKIEKAITATQIDGQPDFSGGDSNDYPPQEKRTYKKKQGGDSSAKRPRNRGKDQDQNHGQSHGQNHNQDGGHEWEPSKPKAKKPHKKKLARAAAKAAGKPGAKSGPKSGGKAPKGKRNSDKPRLSREKRRSI